MKRRMAVALMAGLSSLVWVLVAGGAERLDRGLVALQREDGSVFLSWRLLDDDPADVPLVHKLLHLLQQLLARDSVLLPLGAVVVAGELFGRGGLVTHRLSPVLMGRRFAQAITFYHYVTDTRFVFRPPEDPRTLIVGSSIYLITCGLERVEKRATPPPRPT